jgi:hypothetical protein
VLVLVQLAWLSDMVQLVSVVVVCATHEIDNKAISKISAFFMSILLRAGWGELL